MFFLFYLSLGATVFSSIERPLEEQIVRDLMTQRKEFLDRHTCLSGEKKEKKRSSFLSPSPPKQRHDGRVQ